MKIGMTLPVMEPDLNRSVLKDWTQRIENGPYSSLALGERIAFGNPEFIATLSAAAAWTERVELIATVAVLPMHSPVWLAKQLATIDLISDGRLTAGVGVGGREEDYLSVGADWQKRRLKEMQERVATMRKVWAGENPVEGLESSVGPLPVQRGGPSILAGSIGPKSIRSAANWSDGLSGFSFNADVEEIQDAVRQANIAWQEVGREKSPRLINSFWYAVGDNAKEQVITHLRRYLNWLPREVVEMLLPEAGFSGSKQQFKDLLKKVEDTGCDELILAPTTADAEDVDRIAELISDFGV